MRISRVVFSLALVAASAHAESYSTTKSVCDAIRADGHFQLHTFEECIIDFFSLRPVGPAMGNIGTGSLAAGGLQLVLPPSGTHQFTAKGLYSPNGFSLISGDYRVQLPPLHRPMIGGPHGQADPADALIDLQAARIDLHTQDFYGIGPNSTLAGHAVYRDLRTWIGLNAATPVTGGTAGILTLGGHVKFLHPVSKGVSGNTLASVNQAYGEVLAPASITQPNFAIVGATVGFRTPKEQPLLWEKHEAQVDVSHYSDFGADQFSFTQLEGSGSISLSAIRQMEKRPDQRFATVDLNRPWWKDALCISDSTGHCSLGTLVLSGRVTTSYTSGMNRVPFYLQPTLGGMDFNGNDTLRGLVDYRLRAPNRILFQTDFYKAIRNLSVKGSPVGEYGLYAFVDTGNVSVLPSQLFANGMRSDVGIGASISIQNKVVVRAYIAFGAGEGSHPNAKMANAF